MIHHRGSLSPAVTITLEPLTLAHAAALVEVALEPALWTWTSDRLATPDDVVRYVERALAQQARGDAVPYCVIERATGRAVGSTRFAALVPEHRRVEIGWSWLGAAWRGTRANPEMKLLMLEQAFDGWGMRRVELKTDVRNARSRAAMLKLGAVEEGVLRKHMVLPDGSPRDTVYYAITDDDWPAVRTRLEARLASLPIPSAATPAPAAGA